MFHKIAIFTGLVFGLVAAPLHAELGTDKMRPDIVGWGADATTAPIIGIDYDGDLLPSRQYTYDVGEPTRVFKKVYAGSFHASSGLVNISEVFVDLASGTTRGGVPAAGILIPTNTLINLVNSPTTYVGMNIIQTSGAPRNIICFSSANILPTTTTLVMSATFYGYNGKGEWTWENIIFSTVPISWSTTTTTYSTQTARAVGVGNTAWSYISSFTVQITSMTDAFGLSTEHPRMYIGFGQKIGLANNITTNDNTPTGTDIYKITNAGGADVTNETLNPLIYIDTDQDYIVFAPQPNGVDEKGVYYRFRQMW